MAAAYCMPFPPIRTSKQKQFRRTRPFNLQRHSWKILSIGKDPTSSTPPHTEVTQRHTTNFNPSIWDDHFISASAALKHNTCSDERIGEMKKAVNSILASAATDPSEQLAFIDRIQRLGVAYHFEAGIENALQNIYDNTAHQDGDLYVVALRFRLLKQAGHFVSPGVFSKFKDDTGDFFSSLRHDVKGLLSLYEAAHLSYKGEILLDEAISFSRHNLIKSLEKQLNPDITSQVRRSLNLPLHKRLSRVEASYYISVYENVDVSKTDGLLQLAKANYNALQLQHQTETSQLSRWWKEINIISELPFQPRDRLIEAYLIVMCIIPEPKYSTGRIHLTKFFAILTIVDDIYDAYGTIAELEPLTDAISRWGFEDTEELPGFAKGIVAELCKVYKEIEEEMRMKEMDYAVPYFQSKNQQYITSLLDEVKLFRSNRMPTLEEWLQKASTTMGMPFFVVGLVLSHSELATKEVLDWFNSEAKIIDSCMRNCRILDDIHTYKLEQERGNMVSSVTCYMKEHGVQEDEAIENLKKVVEEHWKEMNRGCLMPTAAPLRLLMLLLNSVRAAQLTFMGGADGFSNSKGHMKEVIGSLLVNPVPS